MEGRKKISIQYRSTFRQIKQIGRIVLPIVLIACILWYIIGDRDQFVSALRGASIRWLVVSQICFICGTLTIGLAWHRVLLLLGSEIGILGALKAFYLSMLAKYIPGRIWGATGRILLSKSEGVPEGTSALGILLETLLLMVSAAAVGGLAITQWPGELPWQLRLILLASPSFLFFLHPMFLGRLIPYLSRRFPTRVTHPERMPDFRSMVLIAGIYCGIWIWWGAGFFFALRAISQVTIDHFVPLVGGNTLAWLAGFVAVISPAGMGVRELILMSLTAGDIGTGPAALAAVITRIFTLASEMIGTLILYYYRKSGNHLTQ